MLLGSQWFDLRMLLANNVVDRLVTVVSRGFQTVFIAQSLSSVSGEVLCLICLHGCSCMCMSHACSVT